MVDPGAVPLPTETPNPETGIPKARWRFGARAFVYIYILFCFVYMRLKAVNIIFVQKDKESCRLRHAPTLVGGTSTICFSP